MNEAQKIILQLAKTHKEPYEFIHEVEGLFGVPLSQKGAFFYQVGLILNERSYFVLALNSWNYALEYFIKNDDKANESACYTALGNVYHILGDFRKAIEYHEKSLAIKIKIIHDKAGESRCYTNLGNVYHSLGDFRKAIEYHEKSLAIVKKIGDRAGESSCYTNLGNAYRVLGDVRKAIEYHEKSLAIAKEIGDRAEEARCYTNLGNVYRSLGDFRKAIEYNEKSLAIAKEIGDRLRESACYTNLGNAYRSLGDVRKAIEYNEKSLAIAKEIGVRMGESACYGNLGNVYHILGDFRKAIEYYEKSLAIVKEFGVRVGELQCYGSLGNAYRSLGDFRKAIEYNEKSLSIAIEIGDRAGESTCYAALGSAYHNLGDFRKAIEYNEKSLAIAKEIGDIEAERATSHNIGRAYHESKSELKLAHDYYKRSIELSEVLVGRLVQEERRIGFYALSSNTYQYMVPLCLKLGNGEEVFEYVERSKSRAFLDLIAATEIKPTVVLTSKLESLLDSEEKYLVKFREIQTRHMRPTGVPVEPGEVENIIDNLNLVYSKIEEFDPEYVFMRRGKPLSLDKTLDMLSSQKRDITLIEYFTTREETFILAVSLKDRELHIVPVPLSTVELNRFLETYRREVVNHPSTGDIGDTWLGLSDYLIEPISEFLTEGELIYFVPYGLLHYLPMHALELRGEPLIRKHPVAYAPSASLLRFCQYKGSGELQRCASFGVVFEKEAEDIAQLFSTKASIGHLVTKDEVCEDCTDKDIIHFSCHGYFNNADPLSSGVELFDKVLTAKEIFNMKLNTELVTLSACQTGLNERSPGDELIGLTRAFLYAGSPSVIVSLWSVDARSTQELMLEFYTLLKGGLDKSTALQEAQKRIMQKEGYLHPYYWAPFILVGDWALRR